MKIGILTFHRPANFGANLQAYSTMCYLSSLGHEVRVIDYVRQADFEYKHKVDIKQYEAHKLFVEARLSLTEQATSGEDLCRIVKQEAFDAILIGADAVWRSPKDNNIYFAEWLFENEDINQVAVASISPAHMGNGYCTIPEDRRRGIHDCLSRFRYITVRDAWTKKVVNRDIFGGDVFVKNVNPDPVFTLFRFVGNEQWFDKGQTPKGYYLMSLPKNWVDRGKFADKKKKWFALFKAYVNRAGYKLVELPIPEGKSGMKFDYTIDYPIDPLQWFLWIKNAKAFCGLRFHAIVSSISNGTPFYSIDSYGDNSRTSKILDFLGLHNLARKRDVKSKIYNLLQGTTLERNRCGAMIECESPKKVFRILESTTTMEVIKIRDGNLAVFDQNLSEMLKAVSK